MQFAKHVQILFLYLPAFTIFIIMNCGVFDDDKKLTWKLQLDPG
jgi:hypothetical protein